MKFTVEESRVSLICQIHEAMIQENKLAVITGATGGIGSSFAKYIAARQYNLVISAYEQDLLEQAAAELREKYHIDVITIPANLAVPEDISALAQKLSALPQVDMLVNCAGFGEKSLFYKEDMSSVHKMINVHISATVELVHAVLPIMIKQRRGSIVTVSSLAAFIPAPGSSIYSSTKAFLNSFMESVHMEVNEYGINVQALCPGLTHTAFHNESDVETSIKMKGVDLWMEADDVVEESMRELDKGSVICIPGCINKAIKNLMPAIPRKLYYVITDKTAEKFK